ncbi:MAG: hypothetical protein ABIQ12_00095 [Opitutaceae bacterium]
MDSFSWQLGLALGLAVGINGWIIRVFYRRLRDQVLLGGMAVFFLMQCLWLTFYLLLTGSTLIQIGPEVALNFNDSPFVIALGQTIIPLVALVVGWLCSSRKNPGTFLLLEQVNRRRIPIFEFFLGVFGVGMLLYFVGTIFVRVPYVTPVIIYLHLSFFMAPLLLGLCWRRYRVATAIFAGAMGFCGLFALSSGSRALLFLPVAYFGAGVWLTLAGRTRVWAGVVALVLAVPAFYLSARIESVRKEGTADFQRDVLGRASEMRRLMGDSTGADNLIATLARGVERMIMWSNFVALDFSPHRVPFRGWEDFGKEMRFMNQSTLFRDGTDYLDESMDREFGIGTARIYGFAVSAGGSVPFPLLADGWSRGGVWGVVLLAGMLCALWGGAERMIRRVFRDQPHYVLALLAILLGSSYDKMSTYGFFYNLRYLVMQVILWGGLFYLASKALPAGRLAPRGESPPRPRRS